MFDQHRAPHAMDLVREKERVRPAILRSCGILALYAVVLILLTRRSLAKRLG